MSIEKFFSKHAKPKYAFKLIFSELCEAKKALKRNVFPTNTEALSASIPDVDFISMYEEYIDETFPSELAAAAVKIMDLADAYGFNLNEYINAHNRYCTISGKSYTTPISQVNSTSSQTPTKTLITYR